MNRNKQAIIDTFWELLEERPLSKITVKDLAERCQINRNTFYYHFQDIPLLLECTVQDWGNRMASSHSKFGSPIDCIAPFAEEAAQRKRALLHIYRSVQREQFLAALDRISLSIVTDYVDNVTRGLALPDQDRVLLIRYYKCLLSGVLLDWLDHDMDYDLKAATARLCTLFSGSGKQAFLRSAGCEGNFLSTTGNQGPDV